MDNNSTSNEENDIVVDSNNEQNNYENNNQKLTTDSNAKADENVKILENKNESFELKNEESKVVNQVSTNTNKKLLVKRYCIIAASSSKPFNDDKSKYFLSKFTNAKIERIGKMYEIKLESFKTYKEAKKYLESKVSQYYNDAFIIKCKVKQND
jgi:hypothetical protein